MKDETFMKLCLAGMIVGAICSLIMFGVSIWAIIKFVLYFT